MAFAASPILCSSGFLEPHQLVRRSAIGIQGPATCGLRFEEQLPCHRPGLFRLEVSSRVAGTLHVGAEGRTRLPVHQGVRGWRKRDDHVPTQSLSHRFSDLFQEALAYAVISNDCAAGPHGLASFVIRVGRRKCACPSTVPELGIHGHSH